MKYLQPIEGIFIVLINFRKQARHILFVLDVDIGGGGEALLKNRQVGYGRYFDRTQAYPLSVGEFGNGNIFLFAGHNLKRTRISRYPLVYTAQGFLLFPESPY